MKAHVRKLESEKQQQAQEASTHTPTALYPLPSVPPPRAALPSSSSTAASSPAPPRERESAEREGGREGKEGDKDTMRQLQEDYMRLNGELREAEARHRRLEKEKEEEVR